MLFPPPPYPAEPPRVVVTGAGIITALGQGWRANADGFCAGRTAFRPVTLFDVSKQRVKTAAQVDVPDQLPATRLSARQTQRLDRNSRMLLLAVLEAWQQAGWEPAENIGIVLGTTSGGMALGEEYFRQAVFEPRRHRQQVTRALNYQAQGLGRFISEALDIAGPVNILSTACAAGSNAIGHAWEMLRRGRAERILACGFDGLSQLVFSGFDALQALSPTVCRPFDQHRDGLALGEGAATLALETLDSARRRNAVILGEIIGYGASTDLHHLTQPHPQGDAALASMTEACARAGITPADVDYINAHGTGTVLNDSAEALAIRRWAGDRAAMLPVSSTKASVGHLLGGSGAVEAVICLMALGEQWLPPETTLQTPDPLCTFPLVRQPMEARVNVVLSNSFGFGGSNATLALRRWA